jgi:iron complex transport system substrate-binding protein
MKMRTWLIAALVPAVLAAAACGSDSEKSSTATAPAKATAAATAAPKATTYPLTVTDMLGRSVTIAKQPAAVAALSPTTVEYVYAVGGTSKTRSTSVKFPAEATSAKDIGPSYQPNFELIAAEKPDLIIADSVLQPQLKQNLEGLNVPVVYAGAQTFADVLKGLELVGNVLNQPANAAKQVSGLEAKLADLKTKAAAATTKPKVLAVNGAPEDFYAAKPESWVGDLVQLLGGDNVAKGQPDVGRFPGYTKLSLETILSSSPDVVLAITAGPPGGKTITAALSENPAWANVPAVKNKRVAEISLELYLQAPGPRAGEALDQLAKLLYPIGASPSQ